MNPFLSCRYRMDQKAGLDGLDCLSCTPTVVGGYFNVVERAHILAPFYLELNFNNDDQTVCLYSIVTDRVSGQLPDEAVIQMSHMLFSNAFRNGQQVIEQRTRCQ